MHLAPRRAAFVARRLPGTCAAAVAFVTACGGSADDTAAEQAALAALAEQGRRIFRRETCGDEARRTDALGMPEAIGAAVDPVTALSVGLKVDAQALPAAVGGGIRDGSVDLARPAPTIALLTLDAVLGPKAEVATANDQDVLERVGIACALCRATVDDSLAPGIGKRLEGRRKRDPDPGASIAPSPALDAPSPALDAPARQMFRSCGKGRFRPRQNIDGPSKPVVIPPACGLQGIRSRTFSGNGHALACRNRHVAVAARGRPGTVVEPRLHLGLTNGTEDRVSGRLPALQACLSLAGRCLNGAPCVTPMRRAIAVVVTSPGSCRAASSIAASAVAARRSSAARALVRAGMDRSWMATRHSPGAATFTRQGLTRGQSRYPALAIAFRHSGAGHAARPWRRRGGPGQATAAVRDAHAVDPGTRPSWTPRGDASVGDEESDGRLVRAFKDAYTVHH